MRRGHRFTMRKVEERRAEICAVECSKCGAEAGMKCIGVSGLRKSPHRERGTAAPLRTSLVVVRSTAPSTSDKERVLLAEAKEDIAIQFEESFEHVARACQSPIERLMLLAMMSAGHSGYPFRIEFVPSKEPRDIKELPFLSQYGCFVCPQVIIGPYRADFVIINNLRTAQHIVIVECDGHDFHEKTKEQAAHDKRRDRYFAAERYTVLHFTGSEIYSSAADCAEEALGHIVPW
jgi:hypothetical protein